LHFHGKKGKVKREKVALEGGPFQSKGPCSRELCLKLGKIKLQEYSQIS